MITTRKEVRSVQISDIFQNETQISFLNLAGGGSCSTFWPSVVGNLNFESFPARPTSRPPHTSPIKHMASAGTGATTIVIIVITIIIIITSITALSKIWPVLAQELIWKYFKIFYVEIFQNISPYQTYGQCWHRSLCGNISTNIGAKV